MIRGKENNVLIVFFAILILLSFLFLNSSLIFAQVNINSNTGDGSPYYELTDAIINFDETISTSEVINNDFLNLFTREGTDAQGNPILISIFDDIENFINSLPFVPDFVKEFITQNGFPTSVSFGVFLALLPLLFSFLPLLLAPQLLLLLLASIFGERKNVLGIVYDIRTTKPLPFVVIRVFRAGSTQLIVQKITDLQGRYGFVLSAGKYRVVINHNGYEKFEKEIEIKEDVDLFAEDIALGVGKNISIMQKLGNFYIKLRDFLLKNSVWLSVVGFIFAAIGFYLKRTALDLALLILYSIILGFYFLVRAKNARRRWGIVKDSLTGLAIAGAFVRVFDKKNNLSDTQITDESGRYSFYVDPGEYSLFTQANGYKFPSNQQSKEVKTIKDSQLLSFETPKPQWLDKQIFVDPDKNGPVKQSITVENSKVLPYKSDNLISPFTS